jgi:murein DD-endopeptidase MepM/ murein hydrolase activator NlpD
MKLCIFKVKMEGLMNQSKKITFFLISVSVLLASLHARFDDVCAYSNESVSKFRKKSLGQSMAAARQYCKVHDLIGSDKTYFDWPIDLCDFWISSLFGPRMHHGVSKYHGGVDMAAATGTAVKSAAPGKVIKLEYDNSGYGNVIEILHKGGMVTRYAHLDEIVVKQQDKVARGEMIATVGATGNVRGKNDASHLHFEILNKQGKRVDPLMYLYCAEVAFEAQA